MKYTRIFFTAAVIIAALHTPIQSQVYKPDFFRFTLDNGMRVILHKDTTTASISVNIAYLAGSSLDPKGKKGLANICGSLVALGSKNVSYINMLRLQYFAAAKISGKTTSDYVSISSTFPSNYLDAALWVEADRMTNGYSVIDKNAIFSAVDNIVKQRRAPARKPLANVTEKIYEELYPKTHPYRHISLGDTANLRKLTVKDVQGFIKRYYVPANACLTVAGNFDISKARVLIEKHFNPIPAGKAHTWKKLPPLPNLGLANIVKEDNVSFSMLYLVIPTVPRDHPDAATLDLLAKKLSGSANATLFTEVVEKNPYVLAVDASQSSRHLDGNFWIVLTCKFETRMKELYEAVKNTIKGITAFPLYEADITEARNQSLLLYSLQMEELFGQGGRADLMNTDALLSDSPLFLSSTIERQYNLPAVAIQNVLKKYFTMENVLALSVVPSGKKAEGIIFE